MKLTRSIKIESPECKTCQRKRQYKYIKIKFRDNLIQDILKFIKKFKFDEEEFTREKFFFRHQLLLEEFNEVNEAIKNNDPEEFVDGLIDLIVISIGTLQLSGVDVQKAWDEVQRANMSKVRGIKPGRESSDGFDVCKPEGWVPPIHEDNHGKLNEIFNEKI